MSRVARLFDLMSALRQHEPPVTADVLSAHLDVSQRTIYRDIDELRSLGVIIDGAAGYGFALIEDNTLPPQAFETEEIEAILLGLGEVRERADVALANAAASAAAKLRARLPKRQRDALLDDVMSSKRFRSEPTVHVNEPELREAIRTEKRIRIQYQDANGTPSAREVDPLNVVYLDDVRCLLANCHLRQDYRSFRMDRISEMEVLEVSFRPHRRRMLREFVARIKGSYPAPATPQSDEDAAR